MQIDLIGYRYTKEELAVLMSLQGYAKIPAVPAIPRPDREQFAAGMDALEENDILSSVGGRLLLDRVHAFLIENLCDCDRYFTVSGGKAFLAACACPKVFITVSSRNGMGRLLGVRMVFCRCRDPGKLSRTAADSSPWARCGTACPCQRAVRRLH